MLTDSEIQELRTTLLDGYEDGIIEPIADFLGKDELDEDEDLDTIAEMIDETIEQMPDSELEEYYEDLCA